MLQSLNDAAMHQMVQKPPAQLKERLAQDTPKSRRTRARILDAAMRLIAERGYHESSNALIADAADITRGAMLYHFPTREDLLAAAIGYIQGLRMSRLQEAGIERPPGSDPADHAIDAYWALLAETPFVAFSELESVARTDASVRLALAPAQAEFDRAQIGEQPMPGGGAAARLQTGRDLARFLLEGLARADLTYDQAGRRERLLTVIKRATHMLNHKGSEADLWPE
jgi:AcrR family transcriptional regulator